jgi:hypothetical protein
MTENNKNSINKNSENSQFNYLQFKEPVIKKLYAGKEDYR